MKTLTTLTAVAALVAGISIASAQTKSPVVKGGAETQNKNAAQSKTGAGMASDNKVTGKSKFCITEGPGGGLKCTYNTMASCEKAAKPKGATCSQNPSMGTTGAK